MERESSLTVLDLPFKVQKFVTSYLDESCYVEAFEQLQSVLLAGADLPDGTRRRIFVPPSQIISLACTLVVYPPLTTRLQDHAQPDAADIALRYLRQLATTGRTTDLTLTEAFTFASHDPGRVVRRRRRSTADPNEASHEPTISDRLRSKVANEDSIFARAEDFWAVVGWAFNCSIKHAKRWERWQIWLELMLDVLTKDLHDRSRPPFAMDTDDGPDAEKSVDGALLTRYLSLRSSGRAERRRMMRAILADGSKKSMAEFGPLWKNETKPPQKRETGTWTVGKLDIENEQYGDYLDRDDEDEDWERPAASSKPRRSRGSKRPMDNVEEDGEASESGDDGTDETTADYGGPTAVALRQRMLGLLAEYCHLHPRRFVDLEDLFDIYTEFLRPLPLRTFSRFVLPAAPGYMDVHAHASLVRMLLRPLLAAEAPVFRGGSFAQSELERYFLPFPANRDNVTDNARVGLLLEALMRLLWRQDGLQATAELSRALRAGCEARRAKSFFDGRRKSKAALESEEYAKKVLEESEERMSVLLDMVRASG